MISQNVLAQSKNWTGATSTDWNTSSNWSPAGVPDATNSEVVIDLQTNQPTITGTVPTVNQIYINANATLTVSSGGTLNANSTAGVITLQGGNIINDGTINVSGGGTSVGLRIGATASITNRGTITTNNLIGTSLEYGNLTFTNESTAVFNGDFNANNNILTLTNRGTINYGGGTYALSLGNNASSVINDGTISITGGSGISNPSRSTITNNACGKILLATNAYTNEGTTTNVGLIQITNNLNNTGTFTNNGILKYGTLAGIVTNNQNSSVIVNNTPTPIFTYGGTFNGTVNGIFSNAAATTSAGTFTAPNTFVPSGLPAGSQTLYAKITPSGGACSYVVPFTYVAITPIPTFNLGTIADPSFCGGSEGSIALNDLTPNTTYSTSYKKNGGSAIIANLTANANGVLTIPNLGAGAYTDIKVTLNGTTSAAVSANLYNPSGPIVSLGTLTNPSTCGGANGSIALNGLKANTLYSVAYNKDNAPTTVASLTSNANGVLTIPNLTAGEYGNLRVTLNACHGNILFVTLKSPTTPVITSGSVRNPSTCGNADGHIILNGLVANTVYSASYKKDGGSAIVANLTANANGVLTIPNLGAGAYSDIRVTLNACTSLALSFTLANPAKTEPVVSANSPVSQGASIQLSVSVAPSYSWKGPEGFSSTSQNPSIPNAQLINVGTYSVTTGGDCGGTANVGVNVSTTVSTTTTTSTTVTVTPPSPPVPTTCSVSIGNKYPSVASSSGKMVLAVNETASSYAWVFPNGFTSKEQSVTVIRPDGSYSGTYNVTVIFSNGCMATASTSVTVTGTTPPTVVTPTPPVETPPAATTPSSALALKIDAENRTPKVSNTVRFAVLVANPTANPSAVATLNVTLPAGLTFANGEGFIANGQIITRSINTIQAGANVLLFFNATVTASGSLTTQANIINGATASININASTANSKIGVEESSMEMSMSIAPNPSQGMMEVVINLSEASTLSLRLTDLMGREISTQNFEQADIQHRSKIDLTQHQVGMYLLTAQANGRTISKKVLKVE